MTLTRTNFSTFSPLASSRNALEIAAFVGAVKDFDDMSNNEPGLHDPTNCLFVYHSLPPRVLRCKPTMTFPGWYSVLFSNGLFFARPRGSSDTRLVSDFARNVCFFVFDPAPPPLVDGSGCSPLPRFAPLAVVL